MGKVGLAARMATLRLALVTALERTIDRLILRWTAARGPGHERDGLHVVVAAPGGGSVGDQAMIEAFCGQVDGSVLVVVGGDDTLMELPAQLRPRVRLVAAPDLLYGPVRRHVRALRRLAADLSVARSFSVVGADVMDGVYSLRSSIRRFDLTESMARTGADARVLGFSWNAAPHPAALAAMRRCRSAVLCARDPGSAARLRAAGAHRVKDVADLAFLGVDREALPPYLSDWLAVEPEAPRVILNANYLLEDRVDQVGALSSVLDRWVPQGVRFILLAHDSRSDRNDGELAREIAARAGHPDGVVVVPGVLTPSAVRELCSHVQFVVTGRMHLAILAACTRTPSIATSYQGKLHGLYERLGLDSLVEPDHTFADSVHDQFERMCARWETDSATIAATLPAIVELARRNLPSS